MLAFVLAHLSIFTGVAGAGLFGLLGGLLRWIGPTALLAHWKAILFAIFVLCVALVILFLYIDLEHTRVQLADAQRDYQGVNGKYQTVLTQNQALSASNANLDTVVQKQNQTIDSISADARAAKADAASAVAAALAKQQSDAATIARLSARIADPKSSQGSCDDEIGVLRGSL